MIIGVSIAFRIGILFDVGYSIMDNTQNILC